MTDTIKKLQEVREVLQWVAGFCDGYVIAPKEGDKLVVERCDKALATLDAVIAEIEGQVMGDAAPEFHVGDVVKIVGEYAHDWDAVSLTVCAVAQKRTGFEYTLRESHKWSGLVDGWQAADLELVARPYLRRPTLTPEQREAFESLTAATRDYFNNYMKDEADSADNCICGDEQHKRAVAVEDALIAAEKRLLGEG